MRKFTKQFRVIVVVAFCAVASACGSSSRSASPGATVAVNTTTTAPAGPNHPAGIIAIGHSGLTGYLSGGPNGDAPENSWATGTATEVDSVYQRLVAVRPETADHVANYAKDGSTADLLATEAEGALKEVPHPALVIIQSIDNDIRCDGRDDSRIKDFGASIADALHTLVKASPWSKILIVTQWGRPNDWTAALAKSATARNQSEGDGPCDGFDTNGHVVPQRNAALKALVERFEAEQARVCATVKQCNTDGGAFAHAGVTLDDLVEGDWNHASITGHAHLAVTIWPTVARLLRVRQ